jgi:hypothetical protein
MMHSSGRARPPHDRITGIVKEGKSRFFTGVRVVALSQAGGRAAFSIYESRCALKSTLQPRDNR